ncbi:MAG TPA: hypothetical protein VD997_08735 [Phycisphaerales bacterium]|nr:hypothetical protein [Phycisphaerales bacterium]
MKTSRPWVRRAVSCVCLGVLTTIAVAWAAGAFMLTGDSFDVTRGRALSKQEWWLVGIELKPARKRAISTVMIRASHYQESDTLGMLPGWAARLPEPVTLNAWPNAHYEIVEGCGWPWVALTYRFSGLGTGVATTGKVTGGLELPPRSTGAWYDPRALPCTPYVPGFAANTALAAVVWFGALTAVEGCGGRAGV